MRHGTSNRRPRNRNNNNGGRNNNNQQRTRVFDSNGPDVRIRGTAHQVAEKYLALAKDATCAGNHVVAENYFQHAEHYIRIINEFAGDETKKTAPSKTKSVDDNAGNIIKEKSNSADVEDLSLPASILGETAVAEKAKEVEAE